VRIADKVLEGVTCIRLDATVTPAHSEKEQASPTWKKTFGHHPMTAWADHGADGNGEPMAICLRPGNAGSNTAADHIETARLALAQLPRRLRRTVLIRGRSAVPARGFGEPHRNPTTQRHGGRSPQESHGRNGTLRYTCYAC
jgi:hypothetical protein